VIPLALWRHQVVHEAGPDQGRPELVPDEARPPDQVDLGVDAPPPRDHQVEPDVAWVVREPLPDRLQAHVVVVDRARGDHEQCRLREREPVAGIGLAVDVDGQVVPQVAANGVHRVAGRTFPEPGRQLPPQHLAHRSTVSLVIVVAQEEQDARSPVVVPGHLVVEAQHL
jgi:hypothetical protein